MLSISVQQVEKSYSTVKAVQNLSFELASGQIFALLGPNGAGKSSLIRMLVGLTRPDSGQIAVQWQDQQFSSLPDGCFGYLPEDRGLYLDKSVSENLTYIGQLRGLSKSQIQQQLDYWLARLDLVDKRKDNLNKLSKGNQQKVQLISCLMHQPDLLILDEPFSGLDPINQEHVLTILQELRQQGTTVLLSAHQMALIERLADQMLLLNKGQVVAQGDLSQVRQQLSPQQQYQVSFAKPVAMAQLSQCASVSDVQAVTEQQYLLTLTTGADFQQLLNEMSVLAELTDIGKQQVSLHELYLNAVATHNQQPVQGGAV